MPRYEVHAPECIRCAACATVAPELFSLRRGTAKVLKSPENEAECASAEVAILLCPTKAIRRAEAADER